MIKLENDAWWLKRMYQDMIAIPIVQRSNNDDDDNDDNNYKINNHNNNNAVIVENFHDTTR